MKIQRVFCLLILFSAWSCQSTREAESLGSALNTPLIPIPSSAEVFEGELTIDTGTMIVASPDLQKIAGQLKGYILESHGLDLGLSIEPLDATREGIIHLRLNPGLEGLGREGYSFVVGKDNVELSAQDSPGIFYGV